MLTIHTALIAIDNIFRFDNNHRRAAYQLERGEGGRTAAAFRPCALFSPTTPGATPARQTSVVINFIVFALLIDIARATPAHVNQIIRFVSHHGRSNFRNHIRNHAAPLFVIRSRHDKTSWFISFFFSELFTPAFSAPRHFWVARALYDGRIAMMIVSYQSSQFTMLLPTSIFVMYIHTHTSQTRTRNQPPFAFV